MIYLHLMMVMSTTHLGIELLDGVSLDQRSLVRTELHVNPLSLDYSLLGELVHLLLRVVTSSLGCEERRMPLTLRISIMCFSLGRSPVTSPMSSRTAFTLFEQTYTSDSTPNSEYSLARVSSNLLQLLGLMALLQTSSNAFPRSLHGDCLFLPTASERQCSGRGTIPHASLKYSGFRFRVFFSLFAPIQCGADYRFANLHCVVLRIDGWIVRRE